MYLRLSFAKLHLLAVICDFTLKYTTVDTKTAFQAQLYGSSLLNCVNCQSSLS